MCVSVNVCVLVCLCERVLLIIITVLSILQYLTDKGEHTALYKINKDVY